MNRQDLITELENVVTLLKSNDIPDEVINRLDGVNLNNTVLFPVFVDWNKREKYPKLYKKTNKVKNTDLVIEEDDGYLCFSKYFDYKGYKLYLAVTYWWWGKEHFDVSIYAGGDSEDKDSKPEDDFFNDTSMELINQLIAKGLGEFQDEGDLSHLYYNVEPESKIAIEKITKFTEELESLL